MASIKTKFTVGLFVAIGLAIAIVAIIWLGMSNYLQKGQFYSAYFDESVQGLDKDSPVKYRGVSIGRVHSISVAPDATLIQVILKIESGLKIEKDLISDLVARLKSVGITGIMFVELERKSQDEPDLSPKLSFTTKYPVIATKPSDIRKIIQGLDHVLNQITELDIPGITDRIKSTLDTINQAVTDTHVKEISAEIRSVLTNADQLFRGQNWGDLAASLQTASRTLNGLLTDASGTLKRFDSIVTENEEGIKEALVHFKQGIKKADSALSRFDRMVSDNETDIREAVKGFKRGMKTADRTLALLDEIVSDNEAGIREAVEGFRSGMKTADNTLKRIDAVVADNEQLVIDMLNAFHRAMKTADVTLEQIHKFLANNEKGFQHAINGFSRSMKSAESALKRMEGLVADNEQGVQEAIGAFKHAMENAKAFMDRGDNLFKDSTEKLSNLERHLIMMLQNLEKATGNLNRFVESIADRPSQLFFEQPPPQPRFERERFD